LIKYTPRAKRIRLKALRQLTRFDSGFRVQALVC